MVEVHLGQLVGGEDPVTGEHGQDLTVPFGQPVRDRHHEPVADLRSGKSSHEEHPKESGSATGGVVVAPRWTFSGRDPIRSGLATVLAGATATVLAMPRIPLT
ncbi:MAG: hypothetical protein M0Z95_16090 [Actinomycetota bacterium]|nr:hypothetical protein [Actinomycetota bacterium]